MASNYKTRGKGQKERGELGIEPRATPTLRVYHTTRPHARDILMLNLGDDTKPTTEKIDSVKPS